VPWYVDCTETNMGFVRSGAVIAFFSTFAMVGGCATTAEEEIDAQEGAVMTATKDTFEQVKVCDNLFKNRSAFRENDLKDGVLRWMCGDVPGVTISKCEDQLDKIAARERASIVDAERDNALTKCGDGFGQEYCEFNAVSEGSVVNTRATAKRLKASVLNKEGGVECVFTSVHSDVKRPKDLPDDAEDLETPQYHKELANNELKASLTDPTRPEGIEGRVAGMKQSVNSRSAADTLIADCSALGKSRDAKLHKKAERAVLCFNAWAAATKAAEKKRLQNACAGKDLGDDAIWKATRLTEKPLSETEKDLAACTMILKAEHGGVPWRNSDPTICARAYRATHECNVTFKGIADAAPDFQGFEMQSWTSRGSVPDDCTYATVEGKEFREIVVCKPNPTEVRTVVTAGKSLQEFCSQKFGKNVAMIAPIGALSILTSAKTETPFCSDFVAGARKAQGK
jgi:hypothetical protein